MHVAPRFFLRSTGSGRQSTSLWWSWMAASTAAPSRWTPPPLCYVVSFRPACSLLPSCYSLLPFHPLSLTDLLLNQLCMAENDVLAYLLHHTHQSPRFMLPQPTTDRSGFCRAQASAHADKFVSAAHFIPLETQRHLGITKQARLAL